MTFDEAWEKLKSEDKTGVFERAEKIANVEVEAIEYAYNQGFKNGYEEGKNKKPKEYKWLCRSTMCNGMYVPKFMCSNPKCHWTERHNKYPYCPVCGSKMNRGQND